MNIKELKQQLKKVKAKWSANENKISSMEQSRRKILLGAKEPSGYVPRKPQAQAKTESIPPRSIDWRCEGVGGKDRVTYVKNQGGCGSCVGFAITAAMEARYAQETGAELVSLSVADAFFCSTHGANCDGWWPESAYIANKERGIVQESLFPYPTAFPNDDIYAHPPSCKVVPNRNEHVFGYNAISGVTGLLNSKYYLWSVGPISAVFQVYEDFYHYDSGVYEHVWGELEGLHAVCIIGYCDDPSIVGGGYWICKNSWGKDWGMDGFFNIAYGQCAIEYYEKFGVAGIKVPPSIVS